MRQRPLWGGGKWCLILIIVKDLTRYTTKAPCGAVGRGVAKYFEEFPAVGDQPVKVTQIAPAQASGSESMEYTQN
jgi:hypothetical protein